MNSLFVQWFYFRASGELQGKTTTYSIVNAGQCAYPDAWPGLPFPIPSLIRGYLSGIQDENYYTMLEYY